MNRADIDTLLEIITGLMTSVSKANIPLVKKRCNAKHYWNEQLNQLSFEKREANRLWQLNGRPRTNNNPFWRQYKDAKRIFRKEQRNASVRYDSIQMDNLEKSMSADCKWLWSLLKRRRRTVKSNGCPIRDGDGTLLTDPAQVRTAWGNYFAGLHVYPDGVEGADNVEFQQELEEISRLSSVSDDTISFSEEDVKKQCLHLQLGKAAGADGIAPEHIRHSGKMAIRALYTLMLAMSKLRYIPSKLKLSLIIPIPKGHDKDLSMMDNFRGISLLPIISKIFEKILLPKLEHDLHIQHFNTDCYIDELQGATHKHCSSLDTAFLLQESLAWLKNNNQCIYLALLDVRKAFDTVWQAGLLVKLHRAGCNLPLWGIIQQYYTDYRSAVLICGGRSDWFTVNRGVHQGAPFSMLLYVIFNNDLLKGIKSLQCGARVGNIDISCPTFADDICLVATHNLLLQSMLDYAHMHSITWQYEFNAKKSVAMAINCPVKPESFLLGNDTIAVVSYADHLGVPLSHDAALIKKKVESRISRGRRSLFAANGLGSVNTPASPSILAKVYWTISVPQITYGLEIVPLSNSLMDKLETAHIKAAKIIQGLPPQTSNIVPLATLGWCSFESFINIRKLSFLWHILVLPMSNIYKRLCFYILFTSNFTPGLGPLHDIMKVAAKYNLEHLIKNSIINAHYMSKHKWKDLITHYIYSYERKRWNATCFLYKRSRLFVNSVFYFQLWPWWTYVRKFPKMNYKCKILIRLLAGEHCLETNTFRFKNRSGLFHNSCQLCNSLEPADVPHMLFSCKVLTAERKEFWNIFLTNCPLPLQAQIILMSPSEKTQFIFSGFRSKFIPEWAHMYHNALTFVTIMYKSRLKLKV